MLDTVWTAAYRAPGALLELHVSLFTIKATVTGLVSIFALAWYQLHDIDRVLYQINILHVCDIVYQFILCA
jgi:hypothetical protein